MTSQKLSRQIGEKNVETNVEEELFRLSSTDVNKMSEIPDNVALDASETSGVRRSKRIPKANRTEKYGAIMLGL